MKRWLILACLAGCAAPPAEQAAAPPPPPPAIAPPEPVLAAATAPITRLPWTVNEPLVLAPRASTRGMELAPLPNRDVEAPRDDASASLNPTLEPMLLPPERRFGVTFGREHLRETGPDRPFDNILPGARLRIPLEPTPPPR